MGVPEEEEVFGVPEGMWEGDRIGGGQLGQGEECKVRAGERKGGPSDGDVCAFDGCSVREAKSCVRLISFL